MKKIISVLLTLTMLLSIMATVPLSASAVTADNLESSTAYTDEYGSWIYEPVDNIEGLRITGYQGNQSCIKIPESIDNIPVVQIGESVFANRNDITSVLIPNSIIEIYEYAFENCTNLTNVYYTGAEYEWYRTFILYNGNEDLIEAKVYFETCVENNECGTWLCVLSDNYEGYKIVDYLGDTAKVVIPSEVNNRPVVEIGEYLFANRNDITSVLIPDSIIEIYEYAFENCTNLTNVYYTGTVNEWYRIFIQYDGNEAIHNTFTFYDVILINNQSGVWLLHYNEYDEAYRILCHIGNKTEIVIPSEVNGIPVVEICNYVFSNYNNITSITIPDTMQYIGEYAFENCTSLTDVYYTGEGYDWYCISIFNLGNDALSNANIHFRTTTITDEFGTWVFVAREHYEQGYKIKSYLGDATEITIPSQVNNIPVTEIGDYVFADCSMTSIILPVSIVKISEYAFENCTSLTDVYFTGNDHDWFNIYIEDYGNEAIISNARVRFDTRIITDEFGTWIYVLKDHDEGYRIKSYSGNATEIVISDRINNKPVKDISESLFENHTNLTKVIIPESIEFIDEYAFNNCDSLTDVYYTGDIDRWNRMLIGQGNDVLYNYETIHYNSTIVNDNYGAWVCRLETFGSDNESGYIITGYLGNASRITIPSEIDDIPVRGLGEALFENRSNLNKVVIPDSVILIERNVFLNCTNLTQAYYTGSMDDWFELQIYDGNDSLLMIYIHYDSVIKTDAFGAWVYSSENDNRCEILDYIGNMSDVRIPSEIDNVPIVYLEKYAFQNYSKLTRVTFPYSIESIEDSSFEGCTNLTDVYYEGSEYSWNNMLSRTQGNDPLANANIHYDIYVHSDNYGAWIYNFSDFAEGYAITGYLGSKSDIRIPSKIDNFPVVEIGESVFASRNNLTSITIPVSVTIISEFAFLNCNNLSSVYYAGSEYEWRYVTMLEGNERIKYATLYSNTDITTDKYGTWTLKLTNARDGYIITGYIGSMNNIIVPDGIDNIPVVGIGDSVFSGLYSLTSVTIPDSVKTIGDEVFYNCDSLTNVTLSNNLTSIGSFAFYFCSSLTNITIPDSVTVIDSYAFYHCSNLASVAIPNGVKAINNSTFSGCENLTSVTLPDTVTSIGSFAFYFCKNLTSITLPESVTSIDYGAFYECSSLTSITIPDNVTAINGSIFSCCTSLTSVVLPKNLTTIDSRAFYYCKNLTNITIPNSVTYIGDSAFSGCQKLNNLTISDTVTYIGACAFINCSSLTSIEVSANNKNYISVDGVVFNKEKSEIIAYPTGKLSKSYIIPTSVKAIPDYLFSNCNSITNIAIPNSVTSIGERAFSDCKNLANIKIPNSVTSIGDEAFYYCISLTDVTLPKNITTISYDTFSYCKNLTSITIPNSVTSIENWAFNKCNSLSDVYYTGTEAQWSSISISYGNDKLKNSTIHYNYVPPVIGDVNGDGVLAVNDVIYVLKNIVGAQALTDEQLALADVSGDGKLTVLDAIMLQRLVLEAV